MRLTNRARGRRSLPPSKAVGELTAGDIGHDGRWGWYRWTREDVAILVGEELAARVAWLTGDEVAGRRCVKWWRNSSIRLRLMQKSKGVGMVRTFSRRCEGEAGATGVASGLLK